MTTHAIRSYMASGAVLTALIGGALGAQSAVAADSARGSDIQLQEVVITAQRRSEDLQKTPIAVTALSSAALEERSVRNTQDLMQVVPSLQVSTQTSGDGSGSATFFLRGFGQQTQLNGSQPAVGVYIDDFYYPSPEGAIFSILDFSQVEVLRGPQGTLFGRNTIGGAIRYTSKKPDKDFGGYVSGTVGSYGRKDISGAINVPIGPIAAVRVSGGRLDNDGFVKKAIGGHAGGGTSDLGRVQVRVQPTQDWTIDLQGQYAHTITKGFAYTLPGPFYINNAPGGAAFQWNNRTPYGVANPYDARYTSACDYCQPGGSDKSDVKSSGGNAVVAWNINQDITVKYLGGYTQVKSEALVDLDGTLLPITDINSKFTTRAISHEMQLNGRSLNGALNWVSGIYFYDGAFLASGIKGIQLVRIGDFFGVIRDTLTRRNTQNAAGYVDLTWAVTDQLSLLGGYRYSKEHLHITATPSITGITIGKYATFASNTGRAGVQYQWTPEAMTYVTISQGFRAGGFNRLNSGVLEPFEPEKDTTYETGARLTLLDKRLRINPTVFYNKWSNIQVQRVESAGGQQLIHFENAAKAHSYGLELEVDAAITQPLHVFGHLATLKARYDDVGRATSISLNSRFQRAPELSGGLGGSYTTQLSAGSVTSTIDYSWQDEQISTPSTSGLQPDYLVLPSYGLTNLRVEFKHKDAKWSVAGFVTNVFDKTSYIGGVNYDFTTPHFDLGRPREYGLNLRYNF